MHSDNSNSKRTLRYPSGELMMAGDQILCIVGNHRARAVVVQVLEPGTPEAEENDCAESGGFEYVVLDHGRALILEVGTQDEWDVEFIGRGTVPRDDSGQEDPGQNPDNQDNQGQPPTNGV